MYTDERVCPYCNKPIESWHKDVTIPMSWYELKRRIHMKKCKRILDRQIRTVQRRAYLREKRMAAPQVPASAPAMCTNCKPPIPFGAPRISTSVKNPGKVYYSCDVCTAFQWYDDYGKPGKKPFVGKRKEPEGAVAAASEDDKAWRLRMESKFDEMFAFMKSAQEAADQ